MSSPKTPFQVRTRDVCRVVNRASFILKFVDRIARDFGSDETQKNDREELQKNEGASVEIRKQLFNWNFDPGKLVNSAHVARDKYVSMIRAEKEDVTLVDLHSDTIEYIFSLLNMTDFLRLSKVLNRRIYMCCQNTFNKVQNFSRSVPAVGSVPALEFTIPALKFTINPLSLLENRGKPLHTSYIPPTGENPWTLSLGV